VNVSTYKILESAAQSWPEQPAIIDVDGSMSFLKLFQECEKLKTVLQQAGLSQSLGLGVMGRNSRAFVAMMLAGMACEAIVIPLSHQLKQAEIEQIVKDTELHAIIDDFSGVTPLDGEAITIKFLKQNLRLVWADDLPNKSITQLPDAAFIRYTSGTTGTSKGVILTHKSIQKRVEITQAALQLMPDDAVLWVLPMAFHFLVTILVYIRSGTRIIISQDILAQTLIDIANRHKATLLYASPMHFRLLAADLSEKKMETLKLAISTSSGIPFDVAKKFNERFDIPITQAYGIIEVGMPLLDSLSGNTKSQSIGYPVNGYSIALLNDKDHPVADGDIGKLAIRGPGMFDAYLKPWQTAEQTMCNGWFMTGDLAQRSSDGRIILCGREKTMINISGNKVFPEEIENVLNSHSKIVDSYVFSKAHPLMGEIVSAEVIVVEGTDLDVEQLLQFCRKLLSTYKIPQQLKQVNEIIHTQSGKIKRMKKLDIYD